MRTHIARSLSIAVGIALGGAALLTAHRLVAPALAQNHGDDHPLIAVCATPTLINELMQSDRFAPARAEVAPELRTELQEISEQLQDLQDQLQNADPGDAAAQEKFRRFRELGARAGVLQQRIATAQERKFAEQLVECFELVKTSADAIADDLGFDYVISTGSPDEELSRVASDATLRQITARPMIRFPKSADITDDVRDDLNLD